MYIRRGSSRTVLVFAYFVIKISKSRISISIKRFIHGYNTNKSFVSHASQVKELLRELLSNIKENWSEFVFYKKHKHPLCCPTYFSLFGILNIQRKIYPLSNTDQTIYDDYEEFLEIMKSGFSKRDEEYFVDQHTFFDPRNFGFYSEKFMCYDYADKKAQQNILDFGNKIQEVFKDFKQTASI